MNIPEILSYVKAQITETKNKISLALFAVLVLRAVYFVLYYLIFALFGAGAFFAVILGILNVLSTIACILLGIYLILLFVRQKQALHLAAGILLILNCLFGGWLSLVCWLAFVVCIALPALKSGEGVAANAAKLALLAVLVNTVLNLLSSAMWRLPRFVYGILLMIFSVVSLVQLVLVVAVFLGEAQDGEAKMAVDGLISKAKNRSTSDAVSQPQTETASRMEETAAPAAVEIPAEPETTRLVETATPAEVPMEAPAVPSGSGSRVCYQYKTVAGPVGLTVAQNTNYADGVSSYAAIIAQESFDGWVFDSIHEIPVTKNNGCLASLMGRGSTTVHFNMLIFRREI